MKKVSANLQPFCTSIVDPENPGWYLIPRDGHFVFEPEFAPTYPETFDEDASFFLTPDKFYPGFSTLKPFGRSNYYSVAGLDDLVHLRRIQNTKEFKNSASQYIIKYDRKGESTLVYGHAHS